VTGAERDAVAAGTATGALDAPESAFRISIASGVRCQMLTLLTPRRAKAHTPRPTSTGPFSQPRSSARSRRRFASSGARACARTEPTFCFSFDTFDYHHPCAADRVGFLQGPRVEQVPDLSGLQAEHLGRFTRGSRPRIVESVRVLFPIPHRLVNPIRVAVAVRVAVVGNRRLPRAGDDADLLGERLYLSIPSSAACVLAADLVREHACNYRRLPTVEQVTGYQRH
jgi:hypothetical protein